MGDRLRAIAYCTKVQLKGSHCQPILTNNLLHLLTGSRRQRPPSSAVSLDKQFPSWYGRDGSKVW